MDIKKIANMELLAIGNSCKKNCLTLLSKDIISNLNNIQTEELDIYKLANANKIYELLNNSTKKNR